MERIKVDELHERMKAQGVGDRENIAFVCAVCGTVQSIASLIKAGAPPDKAENYVGFSCEGRFSNAGPWPLDTDKTKKAKARRQVRGCDWTLGGLLTIHKLEVETPDGKIHPTFELATPEQARSLKAEMA